MAARLFAVCRFCRLFFSLRFRFLKDERAVCGVKLAAPGQIQRDIHTIAPFPPL